MSTKDEAITEITPSDNNAANAVKAVKAGRALDVDIAAQIIAENADAFGDAPWTAEEDKRLMRQVDWRIVPVLFICATLSGLDKTAISAAAIYDLKSDLNLVGQQYSWCGSAPFFGGLLFMGPSAYLLKRFPPVTYFSVNVLFWGITEMCMAACTSFGGLFVCRFLLGGFEALLIPAVTLMVSQWYKPEEQPQRISIILNVIAPIVNGFVAWLISYHHGDYPGWKVIFLSIGAFTIIWAGVTFWLLPNNPLDTPWLDGRQRYMLIQRRAGDNTGVQSPVFKIHQVKEAVFDIKTWVIWIAIIALQVPNGGLTTFNTIIIEGLGFSSLQTSLLAMPPGVMSTLSGIGLSYLASRTRRYRTHLIAGSVLLPLLGAVLCYSLPRTNLAGQLIGLYILYTYWAPYITLVSFYQANIAGHSKKLFLYSFFYISWATGNIIGPQTFRTDQAPAYTGGTIAMIVCYVVAMICIIIYGFLCNASNRKRRSEAEESSGQNDWMDTTDKENRNFIYTT